VWVDAGTAVGINDMNNKNMYLKKEGSESIFESIKRTNENGEDFWSARDLAKALEYAEYRNFQPVLAKAVEACENSANNPDDHIVDVHDMIEVGKGAKRSVKDMRLSRYACYLVIQNADPAKEIVALGQTYFAIQTRKQELSETSHYQALKSEDEKRLFLRNELKTHNKKLAEAAKKAGVETHLDYAVFQDHGYKGLYGGLGAKDIHQKKALKKSQQILDHMGSTELAANLFRATQTEEKLKREKIQGKTKANKTHHEVGQKVRQTIQELGGTMPEDLPVVGSVLRIGRGLDDNVN
jgi:DNA-damage-inducible protein D